MRPAEALVCACLVVVSLFAHTGSPSILHDDPRPCFRPVLISLRGGRRGAGSFAAEEPHDEQTDKLLQDAEEELHRLPQALRDWRHGQQPQDIKQYKVVSRFKQQYSLEQRREMAQKILAVGRGVPVIAERMHEGIPLPETNKPKFRVPSSLTIEQFSEAVKNRLPWPEHSPRTTPVRLFVQEGMAVASAESVGELYAAEKDEDGFLYVAYADSWRPSTGKAAQPYMTEQEFDHLLEDRAQIVPEEELEEPDDEVRLSPFQHPRLKAITLQQPLADAMLLGYKKVEGRNYALKMPKKGGTWVALHVGRSLDHFTNYQVMEAVRKLWPACPLIPTNRKRMGCIVGLLHVKECVPAHVCRDPWSNIPSPSIFYLVIDKVLPLPLAIHHRHSFRMWTVQEDICKQLADWVSQRQGRLFEHPALPRPDVLTEGYQWPKKAKGKSAEEEEEERRKAAEEDSEPTVMEDEATRAEREAEEAQAEEEALADVEERNLLLRDLHPLEQMMLDGTKAGKKWRLLHRNASSEEAAKTPVKRSRIYFLQDFGPEKALGFYKSWVKVTAQTIREKLLKGYKVSTEEFHAKNKELAELPLVYKKQGNGTSVLDDLWDWNSPEEQLKLRWHELQDSSLSDGWDPKRADGEDSQENETVTPAYMKEAIIDHLGVLPPEMVKKSVLSALTPLTEEEAKITIRAKNGSLEYYDPAKDDGSFRLRPGTRAQTPSSREADDPLYVPRVGKHLPANLPTAAEAMEGLIGAPEPEKKKQAGDSSSSGSSSDSSQLDADDSEQEERRAKRSARKAKGRFGRFAKKVKRAEKQELGGQGWAVQGTAEAEAATKSRRAGGKASPALPAPSPEPALSEESVDYQASEL